MMIKEMNLKQIEERKAQIAQELMDEKADVDALETEIRELKEREKELKEAQEKRTRLMGDVAAGAGVTVRNFDDKKEEKFTADSPEYRTAWLKMLAVDHRGKMMFGELTERENRAFTFLTSNTAAVVPTEIMNRIVELVESDSPIYDDATKTEMVSGFEIPRHKSIDAGDADVVEEGAANDDEQDTFDNIPLPGYEIKKHIVMSRKMQFQSIQAFEDWVVSHLAARIRVAKDKYIIKQLDTENVGIAAENKISNAACDDAQIRRCMGLLRGNGIRTLYANNDFIWNTLAALEAEDGHKLFIPSAMDDPIIAGRIYGTLVKKNSNVPNDTFYVGYPKSIVANNFIVFDITPQIENKTLNRIFVGYSLFDAGLEDPKAFVKWTKTV